MDDVLRYTLALAGGGVVFLVLFALVTDWWLHR